MSKLKEKDLLLWLGFWFTQEFPPGNLDEEQKAYKRIVELIKIFFAKEISSGPIKKDISQPDLVEWLKGINQAATAVKDYYVMKATTQLLEMIQKPGVTEKFVDKMVEESVYVLHQDKHVFFERKLKEAGVEVVKK